MNKIYFAMALASLTVVACSNNDDMMSDGASGELVTIASVGVNTLVKNKVDLGNTRNLVIASLILTTGIGGAEMSIGSLTIGGIGLAALVGVILNLVIPNNIK